MAEFMRGMVVSAPDQIGLKDDIPMPELNDYECLVKVHACGFCNGTDIHILDGSYSEAQGMMPYPTVIGHESIGEIVSVGSKVRHLKLGDHIVRPDTPKWYGKYSCTNGTMAEYAKAVDWDALAEDGFEDKRSSQGTCIVVPPDISYEDGGVVLSLLECLSFVDQIGLTGDMRVLVFGAGPMGLGVAAYLRILGADVVIVDGIDERLEYARERFDIKHTVNYLKEDLAEVCGLYSFDAAVDFVGRTKHLIEAATFLKERGILGCTGVLPTGDTLIDVSKIRANTRLHLMMLPAHRNQYMGLLCDLVRSGKLRLKDFYSHVLPVEEIDECIRLVKTKESLKVVLTFDK